MITTEKVTVSPLKWAGAKRRDRQPAIWKIIDEFWDACNGPDRVLVEPFCGALNITLGLQSKNAMLSDSNPHLINFWRWVQQTGLPLEAVPYENNPEDYYAARYDFNYDVRSLFKDSERQAQRFYYLNKTGFRGLCRFNNAGEFNVPFGHYKNVDYRADLKPWQKAIAPYSFHCLPWQRTLNFCGTDHAVIADPPYDDGFTTYTGTAFNWQDQVDLANALDRLHCPVLAHNKATDRILKLYQDRGFNVQAVPAARAIACNGDRSPAMEMVAYRL